MDVVCKGSEECAGKIIENLLQGNVYLSILRAIMYKRSQSPNPILLRVFLRCRLASLLLLWGTSFTHLRIRLFLKIPNANYNEI